jgi:hypothetical protein
MKSSFEIFPDPIHLNAEGQRRRCLIKERHASGEAIEKELWFLYPAGLPMPEDDNCDSYLLAALLPAMQLKADITVYGSVSSELLANLTELQYVWQKWCPEQYFLIDIKVDHIRKNECRVDGAVCAFSGGADAQFTAYRHATGQAGYSRQALRAGVLVHGFDIPLSDTKGFAGAERRASEALDDLGLSLLTVRSNIRELWGINWEHHCGAALASVLCGLSRYVGAGLIGSGEPYDKLFVPWGSHPMTDPLLSTGIFKIIHDGAGFSRSEKITAISEWEVGINNLRVCWAGGKHDRNCGVCEKCVRTRLNFILADVINPLCFSTSIDARLFKPIVLRSDFAFAEWDLIRSDIIRTGKGLEWLPKVEQVLKRKSGSQLTYLFPLGTQRRVIVKKLRDKYLK